MATTFERGILEGERSTLLLFLESKLGTISEDLRRSLEELPSEQLRLTLEDLFHERKLEEWGINPEGEPPTASE